MIMPAFNAARFIEPALHSLLRERGAVDLDIVVVDDGSSDATCTIVEGLARDHPQLRLLHNPRKGIGAARNTGIQQLRPDTAFIGFLDADDVSYPGRIARQRDRLLADPSIDVLYGVVEMFRVLDETTLLPAPGTPTKLVRGPFLQSALYRPHVIEQVGLFDESFRQGCDTDYVLRLIEQEFRLVLDDGIAAFYRRHDANVTLDIAERQREFRIASLRFAARRRLSGKGPIPPVYAALFLNRERLERDFDA